MGELEVDREALAVTTKLRAELIFLVAPFGFLRGDFEPPACGPKSNGFFEFPVTWIFTKTKRDASEGGLGGEWVSSFDANLIAA